MFKGFGLVWFVCCCFFFFFKFYIFEIESHSVAQTSFELVILLSQPVRYQDCRCVPTVPGSSFLSRKVYVSSLKVVGIE